MWLHNVFNVSNNDVSDVFDERACVENGGIALPLDTRPVIVLLDEPEGN